MSDTNERSVASTGSVAWRSLGMISDDRLKSLMADVGMPNSRSLKDALIQCDKEARRDAASRLSLTDAERSLLEMVADHPTTHEIMPNEVATLRGLLERLK